MFKYFIWIICEMLNTERDIYTLIYTLIFSTMRVWIIVHMFVHVHWVKNWMISNGPLDWPNKEMWSQTIYHLEKMHRPVVSHLKMALFSFLAKPPSSIVWITVVFFIAKYENLNWNTFPSWLKWISHKIKSPFEKWTNRNCWKTSFKN